MIEKVKEHINSVQENINILPLETKSDIAKYKSYINDNIKEYTELKTSVLQEINNRYLAIIKTAHNDIDLPKIKDLDINRIRLNYNNISILDRLNLDYLLYKLSRYYQDDLANTNKIILEIIAILKKYGVELTANDFNYTIYVNEYMKVLLSNYGNKTMIHNVFDKIYWKCPYLLTEICLNFKYIIISKLNTLNNAIKSIKDNTDNYLIQYRSDIDKLNEFRQTNHNYLLNQVINKEINYNDFEESNIKKLKQRLLIDSEGPHNLENLLDLNNILMEYSEYLNYLFIIEDYKKVSNDIPSFKGLYEAKLKEIKILEQKLFNYNKKISNNGLFKLSENKISVLLNEQNTIIEELDNKYKELDELSIKKELFDNINKNSTIYDILLIASGNYNYFAKLLKIQNDEVTVDTINEKLMNLRSYLIKTQFNIINNVNINSNINIVQMITDRYKLVNINLSEDNLSKDNILKTMDNVFTLINYYNLTNVNITYDLMKYIFNCKKIVETK